MKKGLPTDLKFSRKLALSALFLLITYFLSLVSSPIFAACTPPDDYSSCQEQNPDTNLDNRGYEPIQGDKNLIPFGHRIDENAPQLSGLIEGNPTPDIGNLYQVYDWDWSTNERGDLIRREDIGIDTPNDFATLVGLNTQGGQAILVPPSGYEIGGGYEVVVLYATPDSITLQYTLEDGVATGYTIHLDNFQVDSSLLAYYNQLDQAGRDELPALLAGEQIGQAIGGEIRVAVRDTGSFLDPRWQGDWWQKLDPAIAIKLGLRPIAVKKVVAPSKFGACQADQPFSAGALTKGQSFSVSVRSCFWDTSDPVDQIGALLKTVNLEFPNNKQIASNLNNSLKKLTPYNYKPKVTQRSTLGRVTFDVCEDGTTNWYSVDKEVEFKTPEWMEQMATEGKELAMMIVPGGGLGSVMGEQTTADQSPEVPLLAQAEAGNIPHGCKYYFSDNGTDCNCMATSSCRAEHSGAGCCPMHSWIWPICAWDDCRPADRCSAGELQVACVGQVIGGGPGPTPTPKVCKSYDPKGDTVLPQVLCVAGECHIQGVAFSNPLIDLFNQFGDALWGMITLPFCKDKTFIVTPKIQTPFASAADGFLRQQTLSIFKVPSLDSQKAFEFEHALEDARHEFRASPPQLFSSETEIYGQRGVQDSYEWVLDALAPYQ